MSVSVTTMMTNIVPIIAMIDINKIDSQIIVIPALTTNIHNPYAIKDNPIIHWKYVVRSFRYHNIFLPLLFLYDSHRYITIKGTSITVVLKISYISSICLLLMSDFIYQFSGCLFNISKLEIRHKTRNKINC